jgi:hypothetical protein
MPRQSLRGVNNESIALAADQPPLAITRSSAKLQFKPVGLERPVRGHRQNIDPLDYDAF